MDEKDFLYKMKKDILNTDKNVNMETSLHDMESWDSIALVSFISMASECTDKTVFAADVRKAKKIGDLYTLL